MNSSPPGAPCHSLPTSTSKGLRQGQVARGSSTSPEQMPAPAFLERRRKWRVLKRGRSCYEVDASIFMVIRSGLLGRACLQIFLFGCTGPAQSVAAVTQDETHKHCARHRLRRDYFPPAIQETVPNDAVQVQAETTRSPNREASITRSDGFASVDTAPLAADAWGESKGSPDPYDPISRRPFSVMSRPEPTCSFKAGAGMGESA